MKKLFLILTTCLFISCDEDCSCPSGPFYGELKIKVTINDENPEVDLVIMRGRIEDADTILVETVTETKVFYEFEADLRYSATATYRKGSKTIVAIDGKLMDVFSDDCDCDYAENITLNLKLAN